MFLIPALSFYCDLLILQVRPESLESFFALFISYHTEKLTWMQIPG